MKEIISTKNTCVVILELLKLLDSRIVSHSIRTAYILDRMLRCKGGYEDYEMIEFYFIATLHDIGAFKVEQNGDMLHFEIAKPMPHSIYGYLFMKYLSPLGDEARLIMYSHVDYNKLKNVNYQDKKVANYLNLAARTDLYHRYLGAGKFDHRKFRVYEDRIYSRECLDLLDQAIVRYDLFNGLENGEYNNVFNKNMEDMLFSEEEKDRYLAMMSYFAGFRSEVNVIKNIYCMVIAEQIALQIGKIDDDMIRKIKTAAMLCDMGMLGLPDDVVDSEEHADGRGKLMREEHVAILEKVIKGRMDDEVVQMVANHHERMNGTGYPRKLKNEDMTMADRIVQVADAAADMLHARHGAKSPDSVVAILEDGMNHNKYNRQIVRAFTENYDAILNVAEMKSEEMLASYNKLNNQYEQLKKAMG